MTGFIAAIALAYAGFAALCLTMRREGEVIWKKTPPKPTIIVLRAAGFLLLVLSSLPWIGDVGFAMGFVSWLFCIVPLAGLPLIFLWPYRPKYALAGALLILPASILLLLF